MQFSVGGHISAMVMMSIREFVDLVLLQRKVRELQSVLNFHTVNVNVAKDERQKKNPYEKHVIYTYIVYTHDDDDGTQYSLKHLFICFFLSCEHWNTSSRQQHLMHMHEL